MGRFWALQVVRTPFTHHQKCLLVDTNATGNARKVTAFLGGIDLWDGRYDTPVHRLFRDLYTVFENDFHKPFSSQSSTFLACEKTRLITEYKYIWSVSKLCREMERGRVNRGMTCTAK